MAEIRHGTITGYTSRRCRCEDCRGAMRDYLNERKRRMYAARQMVGGRWFAVDAKEHGTISTYTHHGCRCVACAVASRECQRAWSRGRAS